MEDGESGNSENDMESETFLEQSLAIDFDAIKGYNPNAAPTNGHEYLFSVIDEAKKCPKVIVSDLPPDKLKKKQNVYYNTDTLPQVVPSVLPSMAWQTAQIFEFVRVREAFEKIKADNDFSSRDPYKELTEMCGDENLSITCLEDLDDTELVKKMFYTDSYTVKVLPQTKIVASLPQPCIERLIRIHGDWLEDGAPMSIIGGWLYALLAALENPLDPDTCSTIRSVAKASHSKRATKAEGDPDLIPLNLIICIIGRFFRQYDLADPSN